MKSFNQNGNFAARFLPFLIAGLTIVLFVIGLIIFSWILIIAAIVGFVLFLISAISAKFSKTRTFQEELERQEHGRTVDHEDDKLK